MGSGLQVLSHGFVLQFLPAHHVGLWATIFFAACHGAEEVCSCLV